MPPACSRAGLVAALLFAALPPATAGRSAPLQSGPPPGERPLPFTSTAVTGPDRGRQHCYVCELKDQPAVLVFARKMDSPTARLLRDLRDAVRAHAGAKLFGWVVFLGDPSGSGKAATETALEAAALRFARANDAASLPITVLGDAEGPPGYRIAPEAATTILFFRGGPSGKVVSSRAWRAREWNMPAAATALRDVEALVGVRPG
jgi:hypothetical protein